MPAKLLDLAREVLTIEAEGLIALIQKLDDSFVQAVDLIYRAKGRVIVTGVGKSGIVARKIVATFNSTGTPALFLHPVEAMHGDLGMVSAADVVLALSNSGETRELTILIPSLERLGAPLIAMTGRPNSTLGRLSQVAIDTGVPREACPLGLAPTASTTAMLAMGDALAAALLTRRGFQAADFRRFHPGAAWESTSPADLRGDARRDAGAPHVAIPYPEPGHRRDGRQRTGGHPGSGPPRRLTGDHHRRRPAPGLEKVGGISRAGG